MPHRRWPAGSSLDRAAAERALSRLAQELGLGLDETAAGVARVAGAAMAQAVRVVTVERGIDPRGLTLIPFGGAGPLHAAQIADELGIVRVVVPLASGVLSALGLVVSERRRDVVESVLLAGDELTGDNTAAIVERLGRKGRDELGEPNAELRATYDLRYAGQAFELSVPGDLSPDPERLRRDFDRAHDERYGYSDPEAELELVTIRVAAAMPGSEPARADVQDGRGARHPASPLRPGGTRRRGHRPRGNRREGRPGHLRAARSNAGGASRLARRGRRRRGGDAPLTRLNPVTLQVMVGALRAACDEMGAVLVRSAHSANIKERRDASTALFDERGRMVMQAEHIPVHLGAMPSAVAAVLDEQHDPRVSWILNDPYQGGTHLPDITVITPLFHEAELVGFAASRAHHADVGGTQPGSLPTDSRTLEEEGVVIPPTRIEAETLRGLVEQMRGPRQREADLRAQLAAGRAGAERVAALIERYGLDTYRDALEETLDYAEKRTRARISELEDGEREARDVLEAAGARTCSCA